MFAKLALLTCLASTLYMTGLIWFVQVVHYPLFARVEVGAFGRYHADHTRLTTAVVLLPMVLELLTSLYLAGNRPPAIGRGWIWAGLGLAAATWLSTALLQVPRHDRLGLGFDSATHRALVATNWLRTGCWTLHALVLLIIVGRLMG